MPWWSWILLWTALIALSLLLHFLLGLRLFRQFMATMKELGAAGEKFSHLGPMPAPGESNDEEGTGKPPGWAVFAPPQQVRHEYVTAKSARREARRQRRVKRRAERGQPQSLQDIESI